MCPSCLSPAEVLFFVLTPVSVGELYFLATSYPSAYAPHGSIYKFVDPSRRAPPGKCKFKPVLVRAKSKKIRFRPRAATVLDSLKEESQKAAGKPPTATLASSSDRAAPQRGSPKKPASPPSSKKTFQRPSTKKKSRMWSPGPQGKRKKSQATRKSPGRSHP